MNLSLVSDRVAVKLDEAESVSSGGIVIPDSAKEKSCEGVVVAAGPGKWSEEYGRRVPMTVVVGHRVIVEKYGQQKIEVEDEELVVLNEDNILAILPPKEDTPAKAAKK